MFRFYIIILFIIFNLNSFANESITIQSTTSTRDSGLYKYLLPNYPKYTDINIKVIAVGTGQAIINAQNCDGNILIVHDEKREDAFMKGNFGTHRHRLMYNDYIIVGPKNNEIKLNESNSITEVFSQIYNNKLTFISIKIPVGHIDRDALFSLGRQTIDKECKIYFVTLGALSS